MSTFIEQNYRVIIDGYLNSDPKGNWGKKSELAQVLGIHSSHLSQILAGTRSLTPDQALILARLMGLTELETEYFVNLVHEERAITSEFKKYIQGKLREIQQRAQKASERFSHQKELNEVSQGQFYSHYLYSAIRLYCSTNPKGRTLEEIKERFQISREVLVPIIEFLVETGLVTESKKHYQMSITSTFLPKKSPHVHRHHANWRILAIQNSPQMTESEFMFTAPMSISKKDFDEIREDFLKQISKLAKKIKDSPAEDIACMNIDFFWVKK